ncbi:unnamed protein product [Protopolystoma xenopodis]|uniref:Uncharacterized protein n=1 Tax=Protopolystoma xenopodis TaxID=117903 RepID=A0A448WFQ5_9PLAT|nr:unnamed protein product [Protopolystoma xenopodis]
MMDESSARFHLKRMSRGLRQPERRIKAKRLQYNGTQPPFSGEIDLRISYSCTFIFFLVGVPMKQTYGVDKTNSRSKLQSTVAVRIPLRVLTAVHLGRRGSNPAEGVDKTNARSKLQTTGA